MPTAAKSPMMMIINITGQRKHLSFWELGILIKIKQTARDLALDSHISLGDLFNTIENIRDGCEVGQVTLFVACPNHPNDISNDVKYQGAGISSLEKWLPGISDWYVPRFALGSSPHLPGRAWHGTSARQSNSPRYSLSHAQTWSLEHLIRYLK